jgi:hypothetical protein
MNIQSLVSRTNIGAMLKKAKSCPEGCFIEVGVYKGGTASHLTKLAEEQNREIYLYDTFEGIPYKYDIDICKVGQFGDTSFEKVRDALPYAKVFKGIFPDSAVEMPKIAFAHLDCDQYKSIIDSVNYITPMMVKGGVIWFDDAPCLKGAAKAVNELYGDTWQLDKSGKTFVVIE